MWYKVGIFLLCMGCSIRPLYDSSLKSDSSVYVEVIAEREGQKLRRYLQDACRDVLFVKHNYRLSVQLTRTERPFAIADDGNAKRVMLIYSADVTLTDENRNPVYKKTVSSSYSSNISTASGEVMLSMYGRSNSAILKELSYRIAENIKVYLLHENGI